MKRMYKYVFIILFCFINGYQGIAQSQAKYIPPIIKIDSGFYGIWKAVEDTDKANFILVQSSFDDFHKIDTWFRMDSLEKLKFFYAILPKQEVDERLVGTGFLRNDTAEYIKDRQNFINDNGFMCYISYFNYHGQNQLYEMWRSFFAQIGTSQFLVVAGSSESTNLLNATSYVQILKVNSAKDSMTVAILDTTLKQVHSKEALYKRLEEETQKNTVHKKIFHLYKVSGYHLTADGAVEMANK